MKAGLRWIVVLLVILGVAAGGAAWWLNQPLDFEGNRLKTTVPQGATARDIAKGWVDSGMKTSPWLLAQWFRWSGESRNIRAGVYTIKPGTTPLTLLERMLKGPESTASLRFTEGWTFRQLRAQLAKAEDLSLTTATMSDRELMIAVGAPAGQHPEGRFFPDTYVYQRGSTDLALLKQAYRTMQSRLDEAWAARASASPLKSPEDLLTLASIVEKETGREEDRGLVAGVFNNRIRIGMPLQTDPTVIYGLGESFDGNLRKRDLQTDNPYNTYLRRGLPPTPISLPGKASLLAAGKPDATKALYFVARGDGTSQFSDTLAEHNRAVNRFQRGGGQ